MTLARLAPSAPSDLLAVQHSPEWPAAMLLLRRLVLALNTAKGLQHPDAGVRLLCIEFLGTVVTQIVADSKQVGASKCYSGGMRGWGVKGG